MLKELRKRLEDKNITGVKILKEIVPEWDCRN